MSDISKCSGIRNNVKCIRRDECYRYTAKSNDLWQAYITPPEKFFLVCEFFWKVQ